MWGVAVAIYASLKLATWSRRRRSAAPFWKHAAYLLAWPGLDVDAFLYAPVLHRPSVAEWTFAFLKTLLGAALLWIVVPRITNANDYLLGWVGMCGLVFVLHFGSFHLLSCLLRSCNAQATPIMNWPIASRGVTEFWGKRWNLAFRDVTHRLLFRPLVRRVRPAAALLIGFAISGLVHELVTSVPAGGGYGLPTLYFAIQGAALLLERSAWGRRLGLGRGAVGWLFVLVVVVLPAPLLFHPPFVCRVVVPFLMRIT